MLVINKDGSLNKISSNEINQTVCYKNFWIIEIWIIEIGSIEIVRIYKFRNERQFIEIYKLEQKVKSNW